MSITMERKPPFNLIKGNQNFSYLLEDCYYILNYVMLSPGYTTNCGHVRRGKSEVFSHDSLLPRILTVFYGEATNIEDIHTIMNHRESSIAWQS